MKISIDAMGGDRGLAVTVPASINILREYPSVDLIQLYGDAHKIEESIDFLLRNDFEPELKSRIQVCSAKDRVLSSEKPSDVLRKRKSTSMLLALESLACGEVDACVSAGNTGALMGLARYSCGTLFSNKDVAICAQLPNSLRDTFLLDVGATIDPTPRQLYHFSKMGSLLHKSISNKKLIPDSEPKVKALSIGIEQGKGNYLINEFINDFSSDKSINFCGLIEADQILTADCDVIICDGFTGNIAIKAIQGSTRYLNNIFENWYKNNIISNSSTASSSISELKKNIEYNHFNGAIFLGLKKIVIKSHGSSDSEAFSSAIKKAIIMIESNLKDNLLEQEIS